MHCDIIHSIFFCYSCLDRVNRHFDVPCPEVSSEDNTKNGNDKSEVNEALSFYQWHSSLNMWYRGFKKGTTTRLSQDRIDELLELGFEFKDVGPGKTGKAPKKTEVPEIPFETRLEQLQIIKEEVGHLKIDPRFKRHQNIGGWAAEISKRYKDFENGNETPTPLEEGQFNELRLLGFEFNTLFPHEEKNKSWQESFDAFLEFQQVYGHPRVPQMYKADIRLGVWVSHQRTQYKRWCEKKTNSMTQEQYDKLESAGFLWAARGPDFKNTGRSSLFDN